MCTAITVQTPQGDVLFGRTMDFSYPLDPALYAVPRGHLWNNAQNTHRIRDRYSFFGIGQELSPVAFADGVNEAGFAVAALYFPGYAHYDSAALQSPSSPSVTSIELIHFLLGLCASVREAAALLRSIRIVGAEDPITGSVAPLHWICADRSGSCMTIEKMEDGLHLLENPIGVLSNSPDFRWHLTNLRNYMNVSPAQEREREWGTVGLAPFGQGAGAFGLPGDNTPPSRFVRAAYQKSHAAIPSDPDGAVTACFHIMESVSIPKGVVLTERGTWDYTQYTAFMNLSEREYYFRTYDDSRITLAPFPSGSGGGIRSLGKLNGPSVPFREMSEPPVPTS